MPAGDRRKASRHAEGKTTGGAQAAKRGARAAKGAPGKGKAAKAKNTKAAGPREGSKTAQVVAMLQRKGRATISEIMKTMGWQRHTVRGFMAGAMEKARYVVSASSRKAERGPTGSTSS